MFGTQHLYLAAPNQNPGGLGTFVYNLRFPGQYYLPETELYYNHFRDYDPQTGRYVESDPMGLRGGSYSTYAYGADSPLDTDDPAGLCKVVLEFSYVALRGYHISVYTSDPNGSMWFSGGPTRKPIGNDPGPTLPGDWQYAWGYLYGGYGSKDTVPSGRAAGRVLSC